MAADDGEKMAERLHTVVKIWFVVS